VAEGTLFVQDGTKLYWPFQLIFQFEVDNLDAIALDPIEHQHFLWASEDEVVNDLVAEGNISLKYISQENKNVKLEAFKLRREAAAPA
jgi:hypothetical protein